MILQGYFPVQQPIVQKKILPILQEYSYSQRIHFLSHIFIQFVGFSTSGVTLPTCISSICSFIQSFQVNLSVLSTIILFSNKFTRRHSLGDLFQTPILIATLFLQSKAPYDLLVYFPTECMTEDLP